MTFRDVLKMTGEKKKGPAITRQVKECVRLERRRLLAGGVMSDGRHRVEPGARRQRPHPPGRFHGGPGTATLPPRLTPDPWPGDHPASQDVAAPGHRPGGTMEASRWQASHVGAATGRGAIVRQIPASGADAFTDVANYWYLMAS